MTTAAKWIVAVVLIVAIVSNVASMAKGERLIAYDAPSTAIATLLNGALLFLVLSFWET